MHYVGKIIEVIENENELYVEFMRKKDSSKIGTYFVYPDTEDKTIVSKNQIIEILEDPKDVRRNRFTFKISNVKLNNIS